MTEAIIVIPCYNEAGRLDVQRIMASSRAGYPYRLLFVNDGSTDKTKEILDELYAHDPRRLGAYHLPRNVGKAEAVRQGILRAFEANPVYVGFWDADLATPLEAIVSFCELLDSRPDLEMVLGARVRLLGRTIERRAARHYPGRAFATVASLLLGLPVYDTQCGAKLFRASPAIRALFQEPFLTRWLIDVEILARLIQTRRGNDLPKVEDVVYEFPLLEWRDIAGSKVKVRDFIKSPVALARIYWKYLIPRRRPSV